MNDEARMTKPRRVGRAQRGPPGAGFVSSGNKKQKTLGPGGLRVLGDPLIGLYGT